MMGRHTTTAGKQDIGKLLMEIKSSDQKSFEQLFHNFYDWLFAVSIAIVREKEPAEEIVEDVFFELWEKRADADQIKSLEPYLYVAVKNRSLDYYRKHSKQHFVEIDELTKLESKISPEDIYLFEELKKHVDKAVSDLPPKCAEVFRLVKLEGKSHKETAEILQIAPKTVENQLGTAVKRMAAALEPHLNKQTHQDTPKINALAFLCVISLLG